MSELDLLLLARFLHIVAGTIWAGGAILIAAFLMPAIKAAGPRAPSDKEGPFAFLVRRSKAGFVLQFNGLAVRRVSISVGPSLFARQ